MQFRELEFVSGAKDENLLEFFADDEFSTGHLRRRFDEPSLADVFWNLLKRRSFKVDTFDERVTAIVKILEKTEKNPEIYILQDLLIEHDKNISLWRYHHVLMVERMLGSKRGTGGSEGVGYLKTTLSKRLFPELWEARTHLEIDGVDPDFDPESLCPHIPE